MKLSADFTKYVPWQACSSMSLCETPGGHTPPVFSQFIAPLSITQHLPSLAIAKYLIYTWVTWHRGFQVDLPNSSIVLYTQPQHPHAEHKQSSLSMMCPWQKSIHKIVNYIVFTGAFHSLPSSAHGHCSVAALYQGTKQIPCLSVDMKWPIKTHWPKLYYSLIRL